MLKHMLRYILIMFANFRKTAKILIAGKVQNSKCGRCRGLILNFSFGYLKGIGSSQELNWVDHKKDS